MLVDTRQQVTQQQFGDLVGITQPAVSELIAREVLVRGATAGEWLLAYSANLREQAAGRAATGSIDLATERAMLAREQRERIAMQNAVQKRELAPVGLLEATLAQVSRQIAAYLEALPAQLKRRSSGMTHDDYLYIVDEIAKARNLAATITLDLEQLSGLAGDSAGDPERPEAA